MRVEDEINDDFNYEFYNMLHDEDEQASNIGIFSRMLSLMLSSRMLSLARLLLFRAQICLQTWSTFGSTLGVTLVTLRQAIIKQILLSQTIF